MKKIIIITQFYKPEMGAPQTRLYEMAVGLKKKGWDVSVITAMPNYPTGKIFGNYKGKLYIKEWHENIEIRRYWLFASNSKRVFPRIISMLSFSFIVLLSAFYLRRAKADYLIAESPPLTLGLSTYIISRFAKSRFILNVSDLWPLSAKELGAISDGFIYRRLKNVEHFLYKRAFCCLGQSQEIVNYIQQFAGPNTHLFRNGVDPDRFMTIKPANIDSQIRIVYTGLLGVAQGILDLCKNIDFNALGVEFHIYGAGVERIELEGFLKKHPARGIYYHGAVNSSDIPNILCKHTATLVALNRNIYGAVPSKIYESMAAGLPILFSGEGEGRAIIETYNLGWTSSAMDYESLQSNIKSLQSEKAAYQIKRENCLRIVTEHFSRPKIIDELHNLLSSIN